MTHKTLTIGCTTYLHTLPLLTHQVATEQFNYEAVAVKNIDQSTLRMINGEFDIGEMSLATFLKVQEKNSNIKALPVFSRKSPLMYAFCSENSDLSGYKDLRGKKVAVFQYWVTASIWHRWLLKNHYNVDPSEIVWCPLRKDRIEGMPYPEDCEVDWSYVGGSPEELLRNGDIDCFFYARKPEDFSGLRWLFPQVAEENIRFFQDTEMMPITHVMAIKESIIESYPELMVEIMNLFENSKKQGHNEVAHMASLYLPFADWDLHQVDNLLGRSDWNENGWSRNKHILETFFKTACEQGFVQENLDWENCFVPFDYEKTYQLQK